jgi:hypothetical protein
MDQMLKLNHPLSALFIGGNCPCNLAIKSDHMDMRKLNNLKSAIILTVTYIIDQVDNSRL